MGMDLNSLVNQASAALAAMDLQIDLKGSGTWAPSRSPKKDYSKWGDWEVWPICRIEQVSACMVGPVHVGGWLAWNSAEGICVPFEDKSKYTAQHQAEILAVSQNVGRPTRVVDLAGNYWPSALRLKDVEKLLGPTVAMYEESNLPKLHMHPQQSAE